MSDNSPGVKIVETRALGPICIVRTRNLNQALTLSNVPRDIPVFTTNEIDVMKNMDEYAIKVIGMIKGMWRGAEVLQTRPVEEGPFESVAPKVKFKKERQQDLEF